jgi:hypothetical protein
VSPIGFLLWMLLRIPINLFDFINTNIKKIHLREREPEVEVNRKRALTLFARPKRFNVPMNDVLTVLMGLY